MGRIFETRKSTMLKRNDRNAKAFTRVGRQISIAVKQGGPDPDANPVLRRALLAARACNMPKDRVEAAIKKASGEDDNENYEELLYEGYAPHGIAVLVETATDNPTRTVANVRMHFNKGGGNMGTTNSVNYMFTRMGVFRINLEDITMDLEELELDLIDYGLEEMGEGVGEKGEEQIIVRCAFNDFGKMQEALETRKIETASADSEYIPSTMVSLDDEQADEVMSMIERLEGDDDVQTVFHNLQ